MAKGIPKDGQREPEGTPKGAKGWPKIAKGIPKDGQREPKGTPKGAQSRPQVPPDGQRDPARVEVGSEVGSERPSLSGSGRSPNEPESGLKGAVDRELGGKYIRKKIVVRVLACLQKN